MALNILGIDPGSRVTGFGILNVSENGKKFKILNSGVFKLNGESFFDRLLELQKSFSNLIEDIRIDEVALESLIYVKSPQALIKLAQARSIILSTFLKKHEGKIFEYSPNLIKSTSSGHGHASKEAIQNYLRMIIGPIDFKTHDESDAIAVAFCHAMHRKLNYNGTQNDRLLRRKNCRI